MAQHLTTQMNAKHALLAHTPQVALWLLAPNALMAMILHLARLLFDFVYARLALVLQAESATLVLRGISTRVW